MSHALSHNIAILGRTYQCRLIFHNILIWRLTTFFFFFCFICNSTVTLVCMYFHLPLKLLRTVMYAHPHGTQRSQTVDPVLQEELGVV